MNIILSIVGYDIWFYISHLILHTQYFYKYHKEHHKNVINLTFMDTYVSHWIEGPFQGIGMFFPYLFTNMTFFEIIISIILLNIRGMMRHDHRCSWIIGNHHLLHHELQNCNYGEYWLDYLFRTLKN